MNKDTIAFRQENHLIHSVVFSKDRAMQLDGLLQSMSKYAPQLKSVVVIYAATTADSSRAYDVLASEQPGVLVPETRDFRRDVVAAINQNHLNLPLTMMLVDDDLFYRPLPEFDLEPNTTFATRLGHNCTYHYMSNSPQVVPRGLCGDGGGGDFDYPASLDGQVYRTSELLPLLRECRYANPNELEDALWRSFKARLLFAKHSCLVGIPHNSVGTYQSNRHAGGSAAELTKLYLKGWRMDLDSMDFSAVIGAHQEIPYKWRRA